MPLPHPNQSPHHTQHQTHLHKPNKGPNPMPYTQDRMLALLSAAQAWKSAGEALHQIIQDTNRSFASAPTADWPEIWAAALMQSRETLAYCVTLESMQAIATETAHFKAHGARNIRERNRQRARRAGLPPMQRGRGSGGGSGGSGVTINTWTCLICEEVNSASRGDCGCCFQPRGTKPCPPPAPAAEITPEVLPGAWQEPPPVAGDATIGGEDLDL